MYIDQFLQTQPKIRLPQKIVDICRTGEKLMAQSPDPLHDHHHLGRLLKHLQSFLKKHPHYQPKIDFAVLLPALCWHDVWKAQRQTLNPLKLIYYQIYEGWGSWKIFHYQHRQHLPAITLAQITYAIRKHSQFQFFSLKTLEAKILRDLDDLDILSAKRLKPLLGQRHQVHPLSKKIGQLFLFLQTRNSAFADAQFPWTKKRLARQSQIVRKLLNWL